MWEVPSWVIYFVFFVDFFVAFFFLTVFINLKLKKVYREKRIYPITFVIPVYNEGDYIKNSVISINESHYPKQKIKIIIVNDGSTDNSLQIGKKLQKKYKNITIFTKKNGGKADALNFGLKRAKTELLAVLDADTILKPDLIEKSASFFSDKTIGAVACRFKPYKKNTLIEKLQAVEYVLAGFYRKLLGQINAFPVAPAFTVFRREVFLKYGYFDTDNMTEDFEMGLRIQKNHHNIGYILDSYALTGVPSNFRELKTQRLRWGYGTFQTYKKYKEIFFNKKYGDLGLFTLPSGFISILMVSFVFLIALYSVLVWAIEHMQMLLVGWIPALELNAARILLFITDLKILLFLLAIIIGLTIFSLARHELNEKIKFRYFVLTISLFLWMLAFFYILAAYYFIKGKKPVWR